MKNNAVFAVFSFLFAFVLFAIIIPLLRKDRFTQFIREEGPKSHFAKAGTPTGGGIVFLIVPVLFIPFVKDTRFALVYVTLLSVGLIGAIDDFMKFKNKQNLGLTVKAKLALEFTLFTLLYFLFRTHLQSGFILGPYYVSVPRSVYFLFFLFLGVGVSESFNLTDGLDGLLATVSLPIFASFLLLGSLFAREFSAIFIGILLAYLWFNSPRADIFMGDTGSHALGGAVFAISVLGKFELLLAFFAIIPLMEALSVIMQVSYFKLTKGKRIFRMAPIHHHFELSGWSESKVVFRFFIITAVSCLIAILLFGGAPR